MSTHNGLAMHITFISFYISIIFTVHIVYHYQLLAGRNWICSYMFSCYSQSFKFFVHRHHAWISSQNSCQLINISCRQCPHVRGEKDSLDSRGGDGFFLFSELVWGQIMFFFGGFLPSLCDMFFCFLFTFKKKNLL